MTVIVENKRLVVELPLELHQEMHKRAIHRNMTIRKYVIKALLEQIKREDEINGTI